MNTEDWIRDNGYPKSADNPCGYTIVDVYRLHGSSTPGSLVIWFDTDHNKWLCGVCGPNSKHLELPGDTHEERCALAPVIARMS